MSEHPYRIDIQVVTHYLAERSQPESGRYAFAYTVTLRNAGQVGARLLTRHWIITDGDGQVQEVRGEGVVGQQPHLDPGASHTYTSGTVLGTEVGSMHGSYQMLADDGTRFEAPVPPFRLAVPGALH
ncbi:MAG TPA: Co2+/Mg2+ efflux protein ApaG [Pseudomonas sp.]|jgi:ApaG protein|nr:Co2+/Mg2+ efflux protein ApaG [Pseudomonas sp.]